MKSYMKKQLSLLKQKYEKIGFRVVGVFGSYARESESHQSDLDIAYEINSLFVEKYSGWSSILKLEEIKKEIAESVGVHKVDLVPTDTPNRTLQKIFKNEMIYV